ncbi:hypothetical protein ACFP4H_01785 [Pseudophaeobacter arcticus]|uniref:hypothetical protein n=1 Tax=Pseudophaeobacter arcticus TaxID=385492 RepID=UPI00047FBD5D|nr:hypothetical protein [Pseudophaeobacter arcticus]
MPDDCKSVIELISTPPNAYEIYAGYTISALPIAAGVALFAKLRTGADNTGAYVGVLSAVLFTAVVMLDRFAPGLSNRIIPSQFQTLLVALLFFGTLFDWLLCTIRTRMRPFIPDAIVVTLVVAAVYLMIANPRYDGHCDPHPAESLEN